jgi:ABC-type antimicrobial peptide transport system permease subunit
MIALYLAIYFAMLYNTFNIIMASIDERREIYASLRRIGFDHSSLRKMVLSEMAFVGSAAAVIGFLIGIISVGLLEGNERSLSLIAMLGQHPWERYIILVIINISFALLVSLICISSNKFKEKIELL